MMGLRAWCQCAHAVGTASCASTHAWNPSYTEVERVHQTIPGCSGVGQPFIVP